MSARFGEADDPQSYAIIGAGMEVHSELGPGFAEPVFQEAFAIELGLRQIEFQREHALQIRYKGHMLNCGYRPDFICFDSIVVELKALPKLTNAEISQTINYLKASGLHVGLLLNFGGPNLEFRRFVN
jgi:GxxExxY protein